ncbi:MAG: long-chain fatty acid--CoA ligase [Campylobacteraceae bacterium]|nr:long-chain fatty acid--CoA ligase [Campylobacteraceae bacterium]
MKNSNIKTTNDLFDNFTNNYVNNTFLNYLHKGKYLNISVSTFRSNVLCLASNLKELGIKENDKVGIFATSSPFWLIFDFAIHQLGAISVPIFANISNKNLNFEINDANITYIFIDDESRLKDIKKDLIVITHNFIIIKENYYDLNTLIKEENHLEGFQSYKADEEDIFSIIYTSGNTGTPKGVMLSHKNILSQINDISSLINLKEHEIILSLLPLAHIFERTIMSFYLSHAVSVYFVDEITNTGNLLKIVRPTIMTAVPRLLDKIFNKIKLNISSKPLISRIIGLLAFSYAMKYDINKDSFLFKLFDKLVYIKLREIFGSRLETLVSGGAPLNKSVCNFFNNIGISIYQGYGLSEFSPVISSNYPGSNKIGSCGKVLPSVEIKFLDKEILARGPSVMKGYLNQKKLTKETIDQEGWLHTGDIGYLDEDKYLYVNSRKKEIYKTSTGQYVNTIFIEQELSKNSYIEFAIIFANNRKYVSALLFVDKEKFLAQKEYDNIEEYYSKSSILNNIEKHINKTNKKLNNWENVIKYKLITKEISIENGELTPSMKICRNKIEELYVDEINTMY